MEANLQPRWVVIGYGNELRGDDGAGRAVAAELAELGLPGMEVVECHQLAPELIDRITRADGVIFVDADIRGSGGVALREIEPRAGDGGWTGHVVSPESLLALGEFLGFGRPRAWCIAIPCERFGWGPGLSERAEAGVRDAVEAVCRLRRSGAGAAAPARGLPDGGGVVRHA